MSISKPDFGLAIYAIRDGGAIVRHDGPSHGRTGSRRLADRPTRLETYWLLVALGRWFPRRKGLGAPGHVGKLCDQEIS